MKICIVIPVYNESRTIGQLVRSIRSRQLDVYVIDDGSTDNSGSIARASGAVIIHHDRRRGKGHSLREGFRQIVQRGYDGVITMDGDGQHDVDDIGQFIERTQKDKICIITGNRMSNPKGMPVLRYFTNWCMSKLISWACRQTIADTQCGYRYISSRILEDINLRSDDFEIESEILIQGCRKGYPVYSLPVKTIYRDEKSQINPFKDTFRFIKYFLKAIKKDSRSYS